MLGNIYPSQIDTILSKTEGVARNTNVIHHENGKDTVTLRFEKQPDYCDATKLANAVEKLCKSQIGINMQIEICEFGTLPRSEKKTKRIYDYRKKDKIFKNIPIFLNFQQHFLHFIQKCNIMIKMCFNVIFCV